MSTYYVLGCPFACIIPMQMRKPSIIMYWIWVGLKLYFRMDDIFSCSMRKSRKSTKFEIGSDGTSSIRYLAIRLSCKIYDTEYLFFYFFFLTDWVFNISGHQHQEIRELQPFYLEIWKFEYIDWCFGISMHEIIHIVVSILFSAPHFRFNQW